MPHLKLSPRAPKFIEPALILCSIPKRKRKSKNIVLFSLKNLLLIVSLMLSSIIK